MVQKEVVGLNIKGDKYKDAKVRIIKERFRNHKIKFNKPLSNIILENLPKNEKFFTKYQNIIPIIFGKDIKGITFNDNDDVIYNITTNELGASSPIATDSEVIHNLKETAETILKVYGMPEREYELIEGANFEQIEGYNL
ncbi:MAG: hypothetical protein KKI06_14295, partial [Euryarchaeota archaeon]|nr:hypothetical protein [Euryarchaeota archaeon]